MNAEGTMNVRWTNDVQMVKWYRRMF
jgi:hypothetical protein